MTRDTLRKRLDALQARRALALPKPPPDADPVTQAAYAIFTTLARTRIPVTWEQAHALALDMDHTVDFMDRLEHGVCPPGSKSPL